MIIFLAFGVITILIVIYAICKFKTNSKVDNLTFEVKPKKKTELPIKTDSERDLTDIPIETVT